MCGKKAQTQTHTDTHRHTQSVREKKNVSSQLLFVSLKVKITDYLATLSKNNNNNDDDDNEIIRNGHFSSALN